jgi:hypothetical protein
LGSSPFTTLNLLLGSLESCATSQATFLNKR